MSTPLGPVATEMRQWFRREVRGRIEESTGGPAHLRVIVLLAAVLGLSTADAATVGAIAGELERSLGLSNTEVGLLVTASVGVGALAALPAGVLADRFNRVRLLWVSVLVWAAAMVASGLAQSFGMLVATRLALGAVVAIAYPVTASLTGDLFPPGDRGRVYGYILSGELVGTGIGFLISGDLAGALSWRAGFLWLSVPSLLLAWAIRRWLPEPARGGQSRLRDGDTEIRTAEEVDASDERPADDNAGPAGAPEMGQVEQQVSEQDVPARPGLVLRSDPSERSLWWAIRYTVSIPTNVVLIVASGLGYFFLQGLQTFAVIYLEGRYGLGQSLASTLAVGLGLGAIVGVLITGRLSDRMIDRGRITARPVVGGVSFLIAAALLVPALSIGALAGAAPLLFLAAAGVGGTNSPLNAARLDLVHSGLWGRAESVRTTLSTALQAVSPLLFGYVSTFFGGRATLGPSSAAQSGATGLQQTFLIMLAPLVVAGLLLLLRARRTYPRDVATAIASERAVAAASPSLTAAHAPE